MRKLLSANFSRLWKDKTFWICIIAMLLISGGNMLNGCRQAVIMKQEGYIVELDKYYFMLAPVPGLFHAVFVSLFLGTEYSDGDLQITLSESGDITFSNKASGLDEVQVGRLFDRFYTVETARKSTGLGLSITRTLVEQMGGSVTAAYENKRLSVCIHLPESVQI